MKILHLDSGREMRGGQLQALRLHRALTHMGHDSFLLAPEASPLLAAARAEKLPADVLRPLRLGLLTRQYDLVHAHCAQSHTYAAMFSRVPFVVSRRVAFPVRTGLASRWKYSKAARFLAVSHYVAMILAEAGIAESKIDVVYDGVELPPQPAQGDLIVAPATDDPAKGAALAREAAAEAGVPIHFSSNLAADLPRARAFIYISQSEGLGSAILLAMAHGLPVVGSRTGGIPEIIEDGVTGILVANSTVTVAAALRTLNADPVLCARMGEAARRAIESRLTVRHMTDATLQSYSKALA